MRVCSTAASKSLAPKIAAMLLTLTTLLEVTSSSATFAKQFAPSVAATGTPAAAGAEDDGPDGADQDEADQLRQPVRVGDLFGRAVIAPLESQDLLGHVVRVVRHEGDATIVMSTGGHLGFGTHPVCVPADALALTGYALQASEIDPADIAKLPPCDGSGDPIVDQNTTIRMKLAKPAH